MERCAPYACIHESWAIANPPLEVLRVAIILWSNAGFQSCETFISTRAVAAKLGMNRRSVLRAFAWLRTHGWMESHARRGRAGGYSILRQVVTSDIPKLSTGYPQMDAVERPLKLSTNGRSNGRSTAPMVAALERPDHTIDQIDQKLTPLTTKTDPKERQRAALANCKATLQALAGGGVIGTVRIA